MAAKVRTAGGGEEFKKPHKMLLRAAMMMIGRKVFELLPPSKCRRSGGWGGGGGGDGADGEKDFPSGVLCVCLCLRFTDAAGGVCFVSFRVRCLSKRFPIA